MQALNSLMGLLMALLLFSHAALAEDIALIYGDTGQSPLLRNTENISSDDFATPLRQAGFRVIEPRSRTVADMRRAAQNAEALLADQKVGRLVIVVLGPFAHNKRETWVLSNTGEGATGISVAATGISINGLSDLAARAGERAVILLAPGQERQFFGAGLTAGLGEFAHADDVTYVVGSTGKLSLVLQDSLLDPQTTFADAANAAPRGVSFSGFLSRRVGLMGQGQGAAAPLVLERGFWQAVQAIDSDAGYRVYLERYPDGTYQKEAKDRIGWLKDEPERTARTAEESLNLSRNDRREIQRNLSLLGFDPRGIDGLFGRGSRAAISAWQRENRFDETGFVTGNQLTRLRDQAKIRAAELEEEARQRQLEQERLDRAYWAQTGSSGNEDDLRDYLSHYPDGLFSDRVRQSIEAIEQQRFAETALAERQAWDRARAANTVQSYQAFLNAYPDSGFAAAAQAGIRDLNEAERNAGAIAQAKAEEKQILKLRVAATLIEQRLAQFGAKPGAVDGKFTKTTRGAIRRFQKSRGLPVTGYVSRATMVRLMAGG